MKHIAVDRILAIDLIFEIGQCFIHTASLISAWFAGIPYLENTKDYFYQGTFELE